MYRNSSRGSATKIETRPNTTGTVAILLTLLEDRAAPPSERAYAGKVLADVGAMDALPTLRRLAKGSSDAEVRAAAREASERITRERRADEHDSPPEGLWLRLEAVLRQCLGGPFC